MIKLSTATLLCLPLMAADVEWSATGTVSGVVGSGLTAAVGAPVSVKFAYAKGATEHLSSWIPPYYAQCAYYGPVGLTMEVTIGGSTWSSTLPTSPSGAIFVDANTGFLITDTLRVTASSADTATFGSFPYTGASSAKSISVTLRDTHNPSLFLLPRAYPDETANASSITDGSGSIIAGEDAIEFTIDPASVKVSSDEPTFPLFIKQTLTGIELRWPTVDGVSYRLEESNVIGGWQPYGSYPGTGSDIVVTLNPFQDYPERRYYRVVTE